MSDLSSIPPSDGSSSSSPTNPSQEPSQISTPYQFTDKPQTFGNMQFTAKEWNQFMSILTQNLSSYMQHALHKMREQMRKDFRRGEGKSDD